MILPSCTELLNSSTLHMTIKGQVMCTFNIVQIVNFARSVSGDALSAETN